MEARKYDITAESDHLNHIAQCIIYMMKYMEENPVEYPPAMKVYAAIMYGIVPSINVNCPHDSECQVSASSPCGGLQDALATMDECYECFELELDFEQTYTPPADYAI
jgi:hypothetical protein